MTVKDLYNWCKACRHKEAEVYLVKDWEEVDEDGNLNDLYRLRDIINETMYPIPSDLPSIRRSSNPADFACTSAMFIMRRQNEEESRTKAPPETPPPVSKTEEKERKKPVQLTLFD